MGWGKAIEFSLSLQCPARHFPRHAARAVANRPAPNTMVLAEAVTCHLGITPMFRICIRKLTCLLTATLLFVAAPRPSAAQGLEQVKAQYTKYEFRVPMRDGKRLFTAVYVPKDQSQQYPILLTRTPYSVQP